MIIVLIVLVGIQFFPTEPNQSSVVLDTDFIKTYDVPKDVQNILKTSCYDCHSNNTKYPWYNKIQPVGWFLEHHINEGKKELNFSNFGTYTKRKQKHKLKAIVNQIKDNDMPLFSYTIIHRDAKISNKKSKILIDWLKKAKATL